MKKKDQAPQPGGRLQNPRRLTLHRETIQHLNDPLLAGVIGGLAQHTFTNANGNASGNADGGNTLCG